MILYLWRKDEVPQIPDFLIYENILHVNYTNTLRTRPVVMFNECNDINEFILTIIQNSDEFVRMLEQFTLLQTEFDSYKTAVEYYSDANKVKIYLLWEPSSNWQAERTRAELRVIYPLNKKIHALRQRDNALVACYLVRDQADFVQALHKIWILHGMLNGEIRL